MSGSMPFRRLVAGRVLTAADVAYVAQLEATTRRLRDQLDVDLAAELTRSHRREDTARRSARRARADLRLAQMRASHMRRRNRRLLALLRTLHPRHKETTRT